ncbi:FGGY-family carbohydrate kinase [Fibrella forsythiae]|uniref:Carbohydrate kinase n=1 Tax=Fibrella forsythiae TaxID=2817061 RepID=A0ABS3JR47_9BACT|nr:FGGY family carbohydrate kinase [Fibrella forsythiae]MBO0952489.1 carbohydrate kinase [Fibrella forsythiae]
MKTPVIAIVDVGKTNKKVFLFDRHYQLVWEKSAQLPETVDEDGDPCEDLELLIEWASGTVEDVMKLPDYDVKALNFTTYGASFVYVDKDGRPVGCLTNYLKPYPDDLREQFYDQYGPSDRLSVGTASPALDSLNSGLQLYRLKHERADLFAQVAYALHLPQYMSYLITRKPVAEMTSLGCHTMLWDFQRAEYHDWVKQEQLDSCLSVLAPSDSVKTVSVGGKELKVGVGLHDSSSALIPYLASFREPFVLISTGTWCISMNPFNNDPLTAEELQYDCLCYLTYKGQPVKASRLFAGNEHEQQIKRLAAHFNVPESYYKRVQYDADIIAKLQRTQPVDHEAVGDWLGMTPPATIPPFTQSAFVRRDLTEFDDYETAYHQLMLDLMAQQLISTALVIPGNSVGPISRIFVDGGFSHNSIYMNLLAAAFPEIDIWAASVAQATALGAALAIHEHWNPEPISADLIDLTYYPAPQIEPES